MADQSEEQKRQASYKKLNEDTRKRELERRKARLAGEAAHKARDGRLGVYST